MKKEMVLGCALLLSNGMSAMGEEIDFDAIKNNAKTITYTLTVSREDACDEAAWTKAIDVAAEAAKRGVAVEKGEGSSDEMVDATLKAMKETYECCGGADGIEGDLRIWFSDEEPVEEATKGCDGICTGDDPRK